MLNELRNLVLRARARVHVSTFDARVSLTNSTLNVKKFLAVINVTYAFAKRKPEKIRLAGIVSKTSVGYF